MVLSLVSKVLPQDLRVTLNLVCWLLPFPPPPPPPSQQIQMAFSSVSRILCQVMAGPSLLSVCLLRSVKSMHDARCWSRVLYAGCVLIHFHLHFLMVSEVSFCSPHFKQLSRQNQVGLGLPFKHNPCKLRTTRVLLNSTVLWTHDGL